MKFPIGKINKLLRLFDGEIKGVHQAALLLGIMGILTKVFGLLRDRILAGTFGAGTGLDIYFSAFRIPDFIFTITLFMTAGASLVPVFLKELLVGEERARTFLGGILTIFLLCILIILAITFILMPFLSRFIAPGFSDSQLADLTVLTRIMLLSPLLLGLSNFVSTVIQSFQKFFIYALSPLLYNFGLIVGITVFYPRFGMEGLAWGVALGAFLHLAVQLPSLARLNFFPKLTFAAWNPAIKNAFLLSFSRTIGLTFNQFILIILTASASFLGSGSISIFNLAGNLQSIPLGIIGLSYSVAAFPLLSRLFIGDRRKGFLENVSSALRHIIFWSAPISALFIVLRAQIVRAALGAGAFSWTDTRLTAASLALFSVSIVAQSVVLLFSRAYYAAEKTKKPLLINLLSSFSIILISFVFIWLLNFWTGFKIFFGSLLRVGDIANIGILSLPFAFSIGSIMNAVFLWKYFIKDFGVFDGLVLRSLKQNFFSSVILGLVSYFCLQLFADLLNTRTFLGIFFQGFFSGAIGISAAFLILYFLKNKELEEIISALRTKFWKAPIITEETKTII